MRRTGTGLAVATRDLLCKFVILEVPRSFLKHSKTLTEIQSFLNTSLN